MTHQLSRQRRIVPSWPIALSALVVWLGLSGVPAPCGAQDKGDSALASPPPSSFQSRLAGHRRVRIGASGALAVDSGKAPDCEQLNFVSSTTGRTTTTESFYCLSGPGAGGAVYLLADVNDWVAVGPAVAAYTIGIGPSREWVIGIGPRVSLTPPSLWGSRIVLPSVSATVGEGVRLVRPPAASHESAPALAPADIGVYVQSDFGLNVRLSDRFTLAPALTSVRQFSSGLPTHAWYGGVSVVATLPASSAVARQLAPGSAFLDRPVWLVTDGLIGAPALAKTDCPFDDLQCRAGGRSDVGVDGALYKFITPRVAIGVQAGEYAISGQVGDFANGGAKTITDFYVHRLELVGPSVVLAGSDGRDNRQAGYVIGLTVGMGVASTAQNSAPRLKALESGLVGAAAEVNLGYTIWVSDHWALLPGVVGVESKGDGSRIGAVYGRLGATYATWSAPASTARAGASEIASDSGAPALRFQFGAGTGIGGLASGACLPACAQARRGFTADVSAMKRLWPWLNAGLSANEHQFSYVHQNFESESCDTSTETCHASGGEVATLVPWTAAVGPRLRLAPPSAGSDDPSGAYIGGFVGAARAGFSGGSAAVKPPAGSFGTAQEAEAGYALHGGRRFSAAAQISFFSARTPQTSFRGAFAELLLRYR